MASIDYEPLLGSINGFNLDGINWVIVGGESSPGERPLLKEWGYSIKDLCLIQENIIPKTYQIKHRAKPNKKALP